MEDRDVDTQLEQHLSGEPPREAFKQQALRDSTAALVRVRWRRSAWRRAELAAAALLIFGVAFLGGRLSVPRALPRSVDIAPQAAAVPGTPRGEPDGVNVPNDLVAWLDAANLFRQLGMEDRMARAIDRAGRLLPAEKATAGGETGQIFASGGGVENQKEHISPTSKAYPKSSAESVNQILGTVFWRLRHEN